MYIFPYLRESLTRHLKDKDLVDRICLLATVPKRTPLNLMKSLTTILSITHQRTPKQFGIICSVLHGLICDYIHLYNGMEHGDQNTLTVLPHDEYVRQAQSIIDNSPDIYSGLLARYIHGRHNTFIHDEKPYDIASDIFSDLYWAVANDADAYFTCGNYLVQSYAEAKRDVTMDSVSVTALYSMYAVHHESPSFRMRYPVKKEMKYIAGLFRKVVEEYAESDVLEKKYPVEEFGKKLQVCHDDYNIDGQIINSYQDLATVVHCDDNNLPLEVLLENQLYMYNRAHKELRRLKAFRKMESFYRFQDLHQYTMLMFLAKRLREAYADNRVGTERFLDRKEETLLQ